MEKGKLLDQVRTRIRLRHFSMRTEQAYIYWIKRFILFHNKRHPREMGEKEVEAFLSHLAVIGKVSASTQNQAFNALLFLYRTIFGRELGHIENVVRANRPRRLPVVFTKEEVQAILNAAARHDQIDRKPTLWLRIPPAGMPQTPRERCRLLTRTYHRARGKKK